MRKLLLAALLAACACQLHGQTVVTGSGAVTSTEWSTGGVRNAGGATVAANATRLYSFYLIQNVTAAKISYAPSTADNSADLYDIGLYNASGSLVCHTGALAGTTFAPNTNLQNIAFTATCSLSPGRYYLAITGNAATLVYNGTGNLLMAVGNVAPSVNNTTTNGVLNSSMTPPADSWTNTNQMIQFSLHN